MSDNRLKAKILLVLATLLSAYLSALTAPAQSQPQNLWLNTGKGCPTSIGTRPVLAPNSNPVLGNPHFRITLAPLPPKAQPFLYLAGRPGSMPFAGCTILIDAQMAVPVPLVVGSGEASVQVPIPNKAPILGLKGYLQALIVEGSHMSLTPRLELALGQAHREFGTATTLRGPSSRGVTGYHHDRQGSWATQDLPKNTGLMDILSTRFPEPSPMLRELTEDRVRREQLSPVQRYIALPEHGHLYLSSKALFVADPETGSLQTIVDAGSGSFPSGYVAVSEDANRVALVRRTGIRFSVILAATDGATLSGNRTYVDVTPATLVAPDPKSLTFVGDRLVFKATLTASTARPDVLFVAPSDGSARAASTTIPALGNLKPVNRIQTPFLSAGNKLAFVGANGSARSDVYAYDAASNRVVNVSGFRELTAQVSTMVLADRYPRAALSEDGRRIAFEAQVNRRTYLYVAPTDGTKRGFLRSLATSSQIPATWTYQFPHFVSDGELLVFAGPNAAPSKLRMDMYRFLLEEGSSTLPLALHNLTKTSGQQNPPFTVAGKLRPERVWTSGSGAVLYVEQQQNGLGELFAVDTTLQKVSSITGKTFSQSNVPPLKSISRIFRAAELDTEPTVMVAATTEGNVLLAWDGEHPDQGVRMLTGRKSTIELRDVLMTEDAAGSYHGYFVELIGGSTPTSATSVIHRFDWTSGRITQQARIPGVISEGSLHLVHALDATLLYALGNNHRTLPTNATVVHRSLRSNLRFVLDTVASMQIVLAAAPVAAVAAGKCKWSGKVYKRCHCANQNSVLTVRISKGAAPNEKITVSILGKGPTFANGSTTATVPCKKGTYRLAIKTNDKPGCFDVDLGGKLQKSAIRVIKITGPEFRNTGQLSPDNGFKNGRGRKDKSLGVGIDPFRRGEIKNVMELKWKLEGLGKKCKCKIDITRTKDYRVYRTGLSRGNTRGSGNDDRNNADEDVKPSAAGNIYSVDSPGLRNPLPGGSFGASIQQHANFEEWVRIKVKGKWVRCTPKFKWQTHLVVEKGRSGWAVNRGKSDISKGHGSLNRR